MHAGALLDWDSTQSSLACLLLPEKCFSGHWGKCSSCHSWHCLYVVHKGPKGAAFAVPALLSLPPGSSCNQLSRGQCPFPESGPHPRCPTWGQQQFGAPGTCRVPQVRVLSSCSLLLHLTDLLCTARAWMHVSPSTCLLCCWWQLCSRQPSSGIFLHLFQ